MSYLNVGAPVPRLPRTGAAFSSDDGKKEGATDHELDVQYLSDAVQGSHASDIAAFKTDHC
jgi:hypothetical protein